MEGMYTKMYHSYDIILTVPMYPCYLASGFDISYTVLFPYMWFTRAISGKRAVLYESKTVIITISCLTGCCQELLLWPWPWRRLMTMSGHAFWWESYYWCREQENNIMFRIILSCSGEWYHDPSTWGHDTIDLGSWYHSPGQMGSCTHPNEVMTPFFGK